MNYVILFKGEILPGFDPDKVVSDFALLEGINKELAAKVFSGEFFVLKDRLTKNDIAGYFPTLAKIGMNVYMEQTVPQGSLSFALMKADLARPATVQSVPTEQISYAPTAMQQTVGVGFHARPQSEQPYDLQTVPAPSWMALNGKGRMGRLNYINASTFLHLISAIPILVALFVLIYTIEEEIAVGIAISGILFGVMCLVVIVYSTHYMILRLHDLNLPGAWAILVIAVNILTGGATSLIISICLMAIPGTLGVNKFGAPSRQGSMAGLVIMIVCSVLLLLTAIVLIAAAVNGGF